MSGADPLGRREVRVAVVTARLLAALPPDRIRLALRLVRLGAGAPASPEQALAAREAVTAASARCATSHGCLQRSLAVVLLCRMNGVWVTWCTGVRTRPFRSHAWVEAAGTPVGEPYPEGYFAPILRVPPSTG
ncbi:lasso peptide biosynthesis B2 protein [Streptomyces sp. UNOC14_S4]|uniref:lasso peptide biosynthesis B2 protein n=1 Tax=Streptomyces sp. UNOC14_S4 TaxID=2872340 RepID=UPI001E50EB2E|nr:lasso peptide biosynthesis B2 protein [Streptomyces sp. UNOC14_S4]MCC3769817.1 lasso peptide biosynthesis B2 protein [Streptomyces sp. UNOC14_S4]